MSRSCIAVLVALALTACAPKGGDADAAGAGADTASMAPMDSIGPSSAAPMTSPPTTLRDSATAAAKGTTLGTPATKTGTIGRDSAFGPTFTVDSNGKLVPIKPKKP